MDVRSQAQCVSSVSDPCITSHTGLKPVYTRLCDQVHHLDGATSSLRCSRCMECCPTEHEVQYSTAFAIAGIQYSTLNVISQNGRQLFNFCRP